MGYELVVSEKPNAAGRIAEALADKKPKKQHVGKVPYYELEHKKKPIVVTCAVGHLYTVAEKKKSFTYPSFDLQWAPSSEVNKKADFSGKYLEVIKKLAKKASAFTVACDYDIEGEVIGLNCIKLACGQKDAKRMKFSTLTKDDLVEAYDEASPHIDWGLANAGEARHFLDWMYGINISRALTLAVKSTGSFKILSSGRVQGPALKIVYDREKEISAFKPEPYWQIYLEIEKQGVRIGAFHVKDKFYKNNEAKQAFEKSLWKPAIVKDIEKNETQQYAPNPFDLGSLQTEAYKLFSLNPKDALAVAQNLYLMGVISYPRTSSQKLPAKINYKKILTGLSTNNDYANNAKKLLSFEKLHPNEGGKDDPAHPAIYPTGIKPDKLTERESKVYDLIVKRFMATFGAPAIRESMLLRIDVGGEIFAAKGMRTKVRNWFDFYEPYVKLKEEEWPNFSIGENLSIKKLDLLQKETQPPKRYTPASLVSELEKRGLGTKATRAEIVDSLYQRNYVADQAIRVTDMGMRIIETLQKYCPDIIDEKLTQHFEDEMEKIMSKEIKKEEVLEEAKKLLTKLLKTFKENEKKIGEALKEAHHETIQKENYIAKCPKCGGNLQMKFSRKTKMRFIACNNYPKCATTFAIPQSGSIKGAEKTCPHCGQPMVIVFRKKSRPQEVCLNKECPGKKVELGEGVTIEQGKSTRGKNGEIKPGPQLINKKCPKCGKELVLRSSIYGKFIGCLGYPKCRYTEKINNGNNADLKKEKNEEKEKI
ncbi:DNA topoisomerase I [Candidatus Woesearchaeota archaeon]|nr:DNA topoisomerase I [Candidatus Woesearchaeota archaeon]